MSQSSGAGRRSASSVMESNSLRTHNACYAPQKRHRLCYAVVRCRCIYPKRDPHPVFQESAGREYTVPEAMPQHLTKQLMPETAPISLVALGNWLLVGFPSEPISSLGLQARELGRTAGYAYVAPDALVNDWIGYILTHHEYLMGGY